MTIAGWRFEFGTVNSGRMQDHARYWSSADIGYVCSTSHTGRWHRRSPGGTTDSDGSWTVKSASTGDFLHPLHNGC